MKQNGYKKQGAGGGMRGKRIDNNQKIIVQALRDFGASVTHLHEVHNGCPDLLIGYKGQNFLLEVKDGLKPPSARRLTPCQVQWHQGWLGQAAIVTSVADALELLKGETNTLQTPYRFDGAGG